MSSVQAICKKVDNRNVVEQVRKEFLAKNIRENDYEYLEMTEGLLFSEKFEDFFEVFLKDGGNKMHFMTVLQTLSLCEDGHYKSPVFSAPKVWTLEYPVKQRKDDRYIEEKRENLHSYLKKKLGTGFPRELDHDILVYIFKYYNEYFFDNLLPVVSIEISESQKFKRTVAYYVPGGTSMQNAYVPGGTSMQNAYVPGEDKILFSNKMAVETFQNDGHEHCAGGIIAKDRLMFVQLTMEHEMCHLAIDVSGILNKNELGKAVLSPHGKLFKNLIYNLFRHTECTCKTVKDSTLTKESLKFGDTVCFVSQKTGRVEGTVAKLNPKTARIIKGNTSYSVPYAMLERI